LPVSQLSLPSRCWVEVVEECVSSNGAGQSHLIFGTGSTGCFTTSQLSKLCYADARYKPLENLDAIALSNGVVGVEFRGQHAFKHIGLYL
jgi:hypothetical protein